MKNYDWPILPEIESPPHKCTDLANAWRVADLFGHNLAYIVELGWHYYDGTRWCQSDEKCLRKTFPLSRRILAEAESSDDKKALTLWAKKSEGAGRIAAAMTLARPLLAVEQSETDKDNWKLNCKNGTVDLNTGELKKHKRTDFCTKITNVEYKNDAQCPEWMKFLSKIFGGNERIISYLQKAVGYSLTGETSEQCMFILWGTGMNGKSTFLTALQDAIGDYSAQTAPDLLVSGKNEHHPTEIAELRGSRFVASVETGDGRRMAENLVKQMTGGDMMKGRFMYKDFFEFMPTHKLWLATNHKPTIKGTDYAIWRRIRLIPFTVTIKPDERDIRLSEKLRSELPGILNWAVQGCLDWQAVGLNPPDEVLGATEKYRGESDVLLGFIEDCCHVENSFITSKAAMYKAYQEWCEKAGEYADSQRKLTKRLVERGFIEDRSTGGTRVWRGVGIKGEVLI